MKILINTRFLKKNKLEGIGWFTYQTIFHWFSQYSEHQFVLVSDDDMNGFDFPENVKKIKCLPPARHPFLYYIWFEWSLPRILKKEKPDVFVSMDGFLSLKSDVKSVMVLHDIAWKHNKNHVAYLTQKFYEFFVPKYCHKAKAIATVSEYSKQDISKSFKLSENKIHVVYNGSNPMYKPLGAVEINQVRNKLTNGKPYFIYLGSIHPRKNIPNLLKAFDLFKKQSNSDMKLVLVGRMAWKNKALNELIPSLEHKDDLVFTGYMSDEQLAETIAAAHALTYLSLFEGFGIPILEAMYSDVPSICSDRTSMPEVCGKAGLMADPTDIDMIAQKMKLLASDNQLRNELIKEGQLQRTKFSWSQTADLLWSVVENQF